MSMSELRAALLREMGVRPMWRLRGRAADASHARPPTPAHRLQLPDEVPRAMPSPQAARPTRPQPESEHSAAVASVLAVAARASLPEATSLAGLDWEALEEAMRACTACALCKGRRQVVPGVGLRSAQVMFVGEGPGVEEDRRGVPFVGPAGKLLDSMLASIGLSRGATEAASGAYIANAVKCHPPHNRTPAPEEIQVCHPFLVRQIELVQPRLLVALGRPAAQSLLGREVKISAARGQLFRHREIPLIVTYHPAYLLRNLGDKARAWEDLNLIRRTLRAQD